ncbi:MAG: histone deacetylase [Cyanothece sp. SIO1E1]|nr:histone deacetylase [Cyanothece sp. SIO1E1]
MLPIIYSDQFLEHNPGSFHPEKPGRLTAITTALKASTWSDQLVWQAPKSLSERDVMPWLQQVHNRRYITAVQNLAAQGGGHIDGDTVVSARSYEVALLAVSAWLDGVDRVLATSSPAFVLNRPPGHHAVRETGMGFCLFANAAIAAHYALQQPGIDRVGILDWDVHHGNGTQALVEENPQIAYCSLHQSPCYPGTGAASERGIDNNVLNLPMAPGSTLADYQPLFEQQVMPFLGNFRPQLLLVSAGYDANQDDPLASISLQPADYGVFTDYCLQLTRQIVFGLEGGYDFASLAQSVVTTVERCLVGAS